MSPSEAVLSDCARHYQSSAEEILVRQIVAAFDAVRLGNGIGFYEADCADNHLPPDHPERRLWRSRDEREYWQKIYLGNNPFPERFFPMSAFAFMDGAGRRFALPCYLLWAWRDENNNALAFDLLNLSGAADLPLNACQQAALFAAATFFRDRAAQRNDESDWEDWENVVAHLPRLFPDFQAA